MLQTTRHLFGSRFLRIGALALVVLTAAAAAPPPTSAATNATGVHEPSEVYCSPQPAVGVSPHAPHVEASIVDTSHTNVVNGAGPNHMQWVGFRQFLTKWNAATQRWEYSDQNNDRIADASPLFQAYVGNQFSYLPSNDWYNTVSGRWETGGWNFPIRQAGYYRVWTTYFWYADAVSPGGSDGLYSQLHLTYTGTGTQPFAWCKY